MSEKYGITGLTVHARFFIACVLSLILFICEIQFNTFRGIRYYAESFLTPVFYLADSPNSVARGVSDRFLSYNELREQNEYLKQQLREIRTDLLRYDSLVQDNEHLRRLNNSPIKEDYRKLGAEVLMVDTNPFSHTIMINRGDRDGVYEGQPVINDEGVIGQVISVASSTSRVLLLSDQNHSIPVTVMRNGIRAIASGTSIINELNIVNMPRNVDIKVGDLLVTSGLGGKFPKGYPVAKVTVFDRKEGMQFAEIKAQPLASLDRLRYMLLIWLPDSEQVTLDEIQKSSQQQNLK